MITPPTAFRSLAGTTVAAILLPAVFLMLVLPGGTAADPARLKLMLGVREEYNDNIIFDADAPISDFITTGTFKVDLGYVVERLQAHAIGRWEGYIYQDNSGLNDVDQDYRLNLDYRFCPRLRGGLSGAYIQDYRRDREAEATGVVFDNEERKRHEMETTWEYMLSEVTTLNLSGTCWHDKYERNPAFQEEHRNLEAYGGNVGITRALQVFNRPVYGHLTLGAYHYEYETSQTDNTYLSLGFSAAVNETYTLLLDLGPRYTESEYRVTRLVPTSAPGFYSIVQERETSRDWGGSGRLSLAYDGEKTNWEAALGREVTSSSGWNRAVERTELGLDWLCWFTWKWQGRLSLRYFINESDRDNPGQSDVDEDTFIAHPQVLYRINPDWSIRGSCRYTRDEDSENKMRYERNQVMLEMIYSWPVWK